MTVDIAAIRAAAEKATPGPYTAAAAYKDEWWWIASEVSGPDDSRHIAVHGDTEGAVGPDAAYIAMLDPQTVLALCDLAERPTPPLAADVLAAVEECESAYCTSLSAGVTECPELCRCKADRTIIAAVRAGAAERERLRAHDRIIKFALQYLTDVVGDGTGDITKERARQAEAAWVALTATPPDAVADEWARLRAIEARLQQTAQIGTKAARDTANHYLRGEASDAG